MNLQSPLLLDLAEFAVRPMDRAMNNARRKDLAAIDPAVCLGGLAQISHTRWEIWAGLRWVSAPRGLGGVKAADVPVDIWIRRGRYTQWLRRRMNILADNPLTGSPQRQAMASRNLA
jgi:hypothetical protein